MALPPAACARSGLLWIGLDAGEPSGEFPEAPELAGTDYERSLGHHFIRGCHPNGVMVNAIDEQHFRGVHRLPGEILTMQPHEKAHYRIAFPNEGKMPRTHWLGRVLARFYKDRFTYRLSYWYGSNGMITFVPEFLHLMFALRLTEKGKTEGRTLVFTRRRRGVFGRIFNRAALAFIHHREQQESFAVAAEN